MCKNEVDKHIISLMVKNTVLTQWRGLRCLRQIIFKIVIPAFSLAVDCIKINQSLWTVMFLLPKSFYYISS